MPEEALAMSVKHGVPRSVREIVTAAAEAERKEDQVRQRARNPASLRRAVERFVSFSL